MAVEKSGTLDYVNHNMKMAFPNTTKQTQHQQNISSYRSKYCQAQPKPASQSPEIG